jgi:dolichol-phosphate mannosyltransferase
MIFVLLPAYNEEDALRPLLQKVDTVLRAMPAEYRVVVVDDGSSDRTAEVLTELSQRYPIDVITHRMNRGLGETERDGFEYIVMQASEGDVVVRMDCDDTHDPVYIPAMVDRLAAGDEVVIASRYAPGGGQIGVDWYRRTISRCANLLMKTVFPIRGVREYTCGYRAYRAALLKDAIDIFQNRFIDLKGLGFTGTVETIIKCKHLGARVGEVGFVLRYDQKMSSSKVVTSITTLGYLVLIAKYIAFWGEIGKGWKQKIAARRLVAYDANGMPTRSIDPASQCAELSA